MDNRAGCSLRHRRYREWLPFGVRITAHPVSPARIRRWIRDSQAGSDMPFDIERSKR
jgi:hypothetical protein